MTTRESILIYLECNPDSCAHDISQAMARPLRTIQRHLTKLTLDGVIHISGYERRGAGTGKPGYLYDAGPGPNATRPRITKAQRNQRKVNWLRQKRRQERVLEKAAAMGVFGVVAAQLDSSRKR